MAAAVVDINGFLQITIGVANDNMRDRIRAAGYTTLADLVRREPEFAKKVCSQVRKGTGPAANKNVSVSVEESMGQLIQYARYSYMVQRPLDFTLATQDNLNEIGAWFKQLVKNQPTKEPAVFTDTANKKSWFESLIAYLSKKTGESGVPLDYVVRNSVFLPLVDQGFATPSPEEEVSVRTRHDGHFWRGDNKMVFLLIEIITHATTAWSIAKAFARRNDGRGAFMALLGAYMGSDVKRLLMKKAEATLALAVYDGKSKVFTFVKHAGRLRESFEDMETSGQVLTGEMKVNKLLASFQFEALRHLSSLIEMDPRYNSNFESAVAFIQGQINSLRLKNGSTSRTVSAIQTMDDVSSEESDMEVDEELTELQSLRRDLKQLKVQLRMADTKPKGRPAKKNQAFKFDKKNPGAYIPTKEWRLLDPDQMTAAREARKAAGIPQRKINLVKSQGGNNEGTDDDDSDDDSARMQLDSHCDTAKISNRSVSFQQVDPSLLVAPNAKVAATSNREQYYQNKKRSIGKVTTRSKRKKRVAKKVAQKRSKDGTENITRRIRALST